MFDLDLLHLKSDLALEFRSKQFEDLVIEKYESFLYKSYLNYFNVFIKYNYYDAFDEIVPFLFLR